MNRSCRVKASAALQEGWLSSFALGTAIFREKLNHRLQAALLLIHWVLGLPENELTAGSVVAKVEPIQNPGMGRPLVDSTPRFARIYTANHEIDLCVLGDLLYLCPYALPVRQSTDTEVLVLRQVSAVRGQNPTQSGRGF